MKYRNLAGTEMKLSEVGFGVWSVATTWWGVKDESLAVRLLQSAYENYGITFFDTADTYGKGKGETMLAEAFPGSKRHDVVIATKFGYDIYRNKGERTGHTEQPQNWTPEFIRMACEQSLKRLNTDVIDIFQMHNCRMSTLRKDAVYETLERLKEEGKIRAYGAAIGPDVGWREESRVAVESGMSAVQIINNLIEQDPARELIPLAEERNVNLLVRVPHASGLLDGSYDPAKHFDKSDHRNHRPKAWMQAGVDAIEQFSFLYKDTDRTIGQAAILFSLYHPAVKTVMPNFTSEEQLKEFSAASDCPALSKEEMERIEQLWVGEFQERLDQPFSDSEIKPLPAGSII